jgi:hypothetical protein
VVRIGLTGFPVLASARRSDAGISHKQRSP